MNISAIILAAGKGTRMRSELPKVLHKIGEKSMVEHVISTAKLAGCHNINVVYGYGGAQVKSKLSGANVNLIEQKEQLGTGHAVAQASPMINKDDTVLVLFGDAPLIKPETLIKLLEAKPENGIGLLTVKLSNPFGYGRIIRENGEVVKIIEEKDTTESIRLIKEGNAGMIAANASDLSRWLGMIDNNNAQQEYYLTDVIAVARNEGASIVTAEPGDEIEVLGANDRIQLSIVEREYQKRKVNELMLSGATLRDPARVDVRGDVSVGNDVIIDINVIFNGKVSIGNNVSIGANCIITDSIVADNVEIKPNTMIESSQIGERSSAGPFARLRPNSVLDEGAHVGNFVEMKNTTLGSGSKAGHLSYLGDAQIGKNANIGAGTITCNYDGAKKDKTIIGDKAFIGSNTSLVAPVSVGEQSTTAAGSVITESVRDFSLAFGRSRQETKVNYWKK